MAYDRSYWKDHVTDQSGEVIQQGILVIHGDDALCHHGIHHRDVQPVGAHLAGDGHQRRTVRIGVREVHHKKHEAAMLGAFSF